MDRGGSTQVLVTAARGGLRKSESEERGRGVRPTTQGSDSHGSRVTGGASLPANVASRGNPWAAGRPARRPSPAEGDRQTVGGEGQKQPLGGARHHWGPAGLAQVAEAGLEPDAGHAHAQEPQIGAPQEVEDRRRDPAGRVED